MGKKQIILSLSEDEQIWIHHLAKTDNTTIIAMIMTLLEKKSVEFGVAFPEKRLIRKSFRSGQDTQMGMNSHAKFMDKINKELGLND